MREAPRAYDLLEHQNCPTKAPQFETFFGASLDAAAVPMLFSGLDVGILEFLVPRSSLPTESFRCRERRVRASFFQLQRFG